MLLAAETSVDIHFVRLVILLAIQQYREVDVGIIGPLFSCKSTFTVIATEWNSLIQ